MNDRWSAILQKISRTVEQCKPAEAVSNHTEYVLDSMQKSAVIVCKKLEVWIALFCVIITVEFHTLFES